MAIRNVRRDAMDDFKAQKKKSEMTEDDYKVAEKDIQKLNGQDRQGSGSRVREKRKGTAGDLMLRRCGRYAAPGRALKGRPVAL